MNIANAIIALNANVARVENNDRAYDKDGNEVIYNKAAAEAYAAARAYKQQRAVEYPPLAEQLDMLYHDRINSTDTWMEAIQAVKNKYPKS